MSEIVNSILGFLRSLPLWLLYGTLGAVFLLGLASLLAILITRMLFWKKLGRISSSPDLAPSILPRRDNLISWSPVLERFAEKEDSSIVGILGVDDMWLENLEQKKKKKDFLRVLKFAPDKGLFSCFLVTLEKRGLTRYLIDWIDEKGDFGQLRRLAVAGFGQEFDGRKAHELFNKYMPLIRDMTGDPEWVSRYFSYTVLLHDTEERSARALWEGFHDSHPKIREMIARSMDTVERKNLYADLIRLVRKDSDYEVRLSAWRRIHEELEDVYTIEKSELSDDESLHILQLLRKASKNDETLAMTFLSSDNLEMRILAARYLDESGALERLCTEVDLSDREALNRNLELLNKAAEVDATGFLNVAERSNGPATLLICIQILATNGDRSLITEIAKKAFRHYDRGSEFRELYEMVLSCLMKRGNDEAMKLLDRELFRRREDQEALEHLLPALPERGDFIFMDTLVSFLKDPGFHASEHLRNALRRMPADLVIPHLFDILFRNREAYPHSVRRQALVLLGEMNMPYCLGIILEDLPLLPLEEARDFARILKGYPRDMFIDKAQKLLEGEDGRTRAALISCLSVTEEMDFLPTIRASLKDADPDVRIASVWALVEFDDTRSVNQAFELLRDPVERVREEVAKAMGTIGTATALTELARVVEDENEVNSVKKAAVQGLGKAKSPRSIDILSKRLEFEDELAVEFVQSLSGKTDRKEITTLIENVKDGSPVLRDKIKMVFREMGEEGEKALTDLLREDIASLKPFIVETLESCGYVESTIRKLAHRDVTVRRDAAGFLALVGTKSAFRGIVLAARDPDDQVRVQVIKALETLETKEGNTILRELEEDPDRRVRKYTHWALERLKSKAL